MTLDIAAIKARADKATVGPWAKNPFTAHVDAFETGVPLPVCALLWPTDLRTEDQVIADGEFIAHARTDIPALLAALEAAERERDTLREALIEIGNYAHTQSTGPAIPDPFWSIRDMAYAAIETPDERQTRVSREVALEASK